MVIRWQKTTVCGLALLSAGCFLFKDTLPTHTANHTFGIRTPDSTEARARVAYDTRLIEQVVDEEYLSLRLWETTSDPLPHDQSAILAANGVQVRVFSDPIPEELEKLAISEGSVVAPMLRTGLLGHPKIIPVNGPIDRYSAQVMDRFTDVRRQLDLSEIECAVRVTGSSEGVDHVRLTCELLLQHGQKRTWWKPTDEGEFERTDEPISEEFPTLTFDVVLSPQDTLVIGQLSDIDSSLGQAFFMTPDNSKRRVLVIRARIDSELRITP